MSISSVNFTMTRIALYPILAPQQGRYYDGVVVMSAVVDRFTQSPLASCHLTVKQSHPLVV